MSTTESITVAVPQPRPMSKPRQRWWIGMLGLVALVGLSGAAMFGYLLLSVENEWHDAEAEADQVDPRWRLMDLEADRPAIPAAENAANVIIVAHSKGLRVEVAAAPNYEQIFATVPPTAQLNVQQIQLIQMQLNKIPAALADARTLKDLPRGRFAVTYSDQWIDTLIPNHQNVRTLADWLAHDAYLLAQEERIDEALESCRASLNAGRTAGDDRFLIAHLIRLALQNIAIRAIERVLAQGQASDESLRELQTLIAREMAECNWAGAVQGERAGAHHLFENLRSDKVTIPALRGMTMGGKPTNLSEWMMDIFPRTMLKHYPEYLRNMNRVVEITKLPLHEQKAKLAEIKTTRNESRNPVVVLLFPSLDKVYGADCRGQASLRSTLVALACERYRLQNDNRWPASLDLLVTEKLLPALPVDPFDAQPLRYRRNADGIVIYSIGTDEKDDQGNIDRDRMNQPGVDVGFRLWNVPQRRGRPLPPIAILEGGAVP